MRQVSRANNERSTSRIVLIILMITKWRLKMRRHFDSVCDGLTAAAEQDEQQNQAAAVSTEEATASAATTGAAATSQVSGVASATTIPVE